MLLKVVTADLSVPATVFRFVVPGQEQWSLRSVRATADRDAGGVPSRAYQLSVTDGTTTVASVGATDNGSEPGTCDITWANTAGGTIAAGSEGITVAPLPTLILNPGYVIIGTILGAVGVDQWADAVVWVDFAYTA